MLKRLGLSALTTITTATIALAGEPPMPTTDFSGDMVVQAKGKQLTMTLHYSVDKQAMRTQMRQQGMTMDAVRDMNSGEIIMWTNQMPGTAMRLKTPSGKDTEASNTGETKEIGGQSCTVWVFEEAKACLTDENIPLETVAEGVTARMENLRVETQDAALFEKPAGMKVMEMPMQIPGLPDMKQGLPF